MPDLPRELLVGQPNLGNREALLARIEAMLDARWFSNGGPMVREFEEKIAAYLGVRHAICVCNATIGLEIAYRALGLSGEVIVPAYTFVATAHALQWLGIRPVFADMDPATHLLDVRSVEALITPRTSAIVGVHLWGRACDTEALEAVAGKHGVPVLYDAAHAFGCSRKGRMVGGFGACEVFSFHATKFLNSFEGGAITTNDDGLAAKLRLMRNFGFKGFDNVIEEGTNGKMTEVCAAMGLTSLESVAELIALNRRNYLSYKEGLVGLRGLSLIDYPESERQNYQYIVVELDSTRAPVSRDALVSILHAEGVMARKYFWPGCHRMEPYRTTYPEAATHLPYTELIAGNILVLPTGQAVSEVEVGRVCSIIRNSWSA